jgi:hypothetical protein
MLRISTIFHKLPVLETRRILPDFAVLSKQKLDEEVTGSALELDNISFVDSQERELASFR